MMRQEECREGENKDGEGNQGVVAAKSLNVNEVSDV
jgi:hypothetical protein